MEKDRLDYLIGDTIKDDLKDMKMSNDLKSKIKMSTIEKPDSIFEKINKIMNKTIEISIPSAVAVCMMVIFLVSSSLAVTVNMKKDKSIYGYTSVKIVKANGFEIVINKYEGEDFNEKN